MSRSSSTIWAISGIFPLTFYGASLKGNRGGRRKIDGGGEKSSKNKGEEGKNLFVGDEEYHCCAV